MLIAKERNSMTWAGYGSKKHPQNASQRKGTSQVQEPMMPALPRGYLKISGACKALGFGFRGKVVLDIGSSTGGFTQYALEHGATKVIAVEKGTNQMKAPLRHDQRIDLHEKTDFLTFRSAEHIDAIVADISFTSLRPILIHAKSLSTHKTQYLVMFKPQFEASTTQLNKGIVKNETIRRQIIKSFEQWLGRNGFIILGKCDNQVHGRKGNIEKFYYLGLAK